MLAAAVHRPEKLNSFELIVAIRVAQPPDALLGRTSSTIT